MLYVGLFLCFILPFFLQLFPVFQPAKTMRARPVIPSSVVLWLSFTLGLLVIHPRGAFTIAVVIAGLVLVMTDYMTNYLQVHAIWRMVGRVVASFIVALFGGIQLDSMFVPFIDGPIPFSSMTVPFTVLWFMFVMSLVHLADKHFKQGTRVVSIVMTILLALAVVSGHSYVVMFTGLLLLSIIGNQHATANGQHASSLEWLGFMMGVATLLGFNETIGTFLIPATLLAFTTVAAFVYVYMNGSSWMRKIMIYTLTSGVSLIFVVLSLKYVFLTILTLSTIYLIIDHTIESQTT